MDGCQKAMLSTEAWGMGLLPLRLPGRGRMPCGACIQICTHNLPKLLLS